MNSGIFFAGGAFFLWGIFPLYWKLLRDVPATEMIAHRIIWAMAAIFVLLVCKKRTAFIADFIKDPMSGIPYLLTGTILAGNWLVFIWAINNNLLLEASLGYFICPLVSIVLGLIVLGEKLRALQSIAVLMAAIAVTFMTVSYGKIPFVALGLAVSFGIYGLMRKKARLSSIEGLFLETFFLTLPALLYIFSLESGNTGHFIFASINTKLLIAISGPVTALPLILFAVGVRRVQLTTIGLMQYLAPLMQFLLAIFVFKEPFDQQKLIPFSLIWLALSLYSLDGYLRVNRPPLKNL